LAADPLNASHLQSDWNLILICALAQYYILYVARASNST
jgi:hypothetical protein